MFVRFGEGEGTGVWSHIIGPQFDGGRRVCSLAWYAAHRASEPNPCVASVVLVVVDHDDDDDDDDDDYDDDDTVFVFLCVVST